MRRIAVIVACCMIPGVATAQESSAELDRSTPAIEIAACPTEPFDVDELRRRVALELGDAQRDDVAVSVDLVCGSSEATVIVLEGGTETRRVVDLGHAAGTARVWALAIVIADFVRRPTEPASRERTGDLPQPARNLSAPQIVDDERPAHEQAPVSRPHTFVSVGLAGQLTLDGPTGVGSAVIALGHDWFRVAITAGGTSRGNALGQITAALALVDVSVLPLSYTDASWGIAAELFVRGGILHASGSAASPSIEASDAASAVLGGGAGVRLRIAPGASIGADIGLRVGYDVLGATLVAGGEPLLRVFGLFAALDAGLAFRVD